MFFYTRDFLGGKSRGLNHQGGDHEDVPDVPQIFRGWKQPPKRQVRKTCHLYDPGVLHGASRHGGEKRLPMPGLHEKMTFFNNTI